MWVPLSFSGSSVNRYLTVHLQLYIHVEGNFSADFGMKAAKVIEF